MIGRWELLAPFEKEQSACNIDHSVAVYMELMESVFVVDGGSNRLFRNNRCDRYNNNRDMPLSRAVKVAARGCCGEIRL